MENSYHYDELLVKYLLNELNEAEEVDVLQWIDSNKQNRQYFDELKNTWRLTALKNSLNAVNVDNEWRQFEQKIFFKKNTDKQDLQKIEPGEDDKPNKKATLYKIIISTAIAASVVFALVLGGGLFNTQKTNDGVIVQQGRSKTDSFVAFIRQEINTSGKLKKFVLQDGTEVTLSDKSEVSFPEPFINNRRDITLKGKACFEVAKDKKRPFTVFSGNLSTAALGTQFSVTAFAHQNYIIVRLFEGKVVVKPHYNMINRPENDFYLLAGQELIYNNQQATVKVRKFTGNTGVVKTNKEKPSADILTIPENEKGSWFMFNNQSLERVFDELGNMYEVEIEYSKRDVFKRYFIGKFDRKDSVESIIKQIAALNNLKVIKKNSKFIIKK